MKSKFFWLLITFILSNLTMIQAQKFKRDRVDIRHVLLPLKKLPDNIETYSAHINTLNTSYGNVLGTQNDLLKFTLNGYHKLQANADLTIEAHIREGLILNGIDAYYTKESYKKDKDAPEIPYYAYHYTVSYYTPGIDLKVTGKSGENIYTGTFGAQKLTNKFSNGTSYSTAYKSESALVSAWANQKNSFLRDIEINAHQSTINTISALLSSYCLQVGLEEAAMRYVASSKNENFDDVNEPLTYFKQSVSFIQTDRIEKINKLVQPDYEKRVETMKKAIALWEAIMEKIDYEDKKARLDAEVARHISFNLANAYLWINDFEKAKQYLQVRNDDTDRTDVKIATGIKKLAELIADLETRYRFNSWRPILLVNDAPFQEPIEKPLNNGAGSSGNIPNRTNNGLPTNNAPNFTNTNISTSDNTVARESNLAEDNSTDKFPEKQGNEPNEEQLLADFQPKIEKGKPSFVHIYRPKFIINKGVDYIIYFNGMPIHYIGDGERLSFQLYSEGVLQVEIAKGYGARINHDKSKLDYESFSKNRVSKKEGGLISVNQSGTINLKAENHYYFKVDSKLGKLKFDEEAEGKAALDDDDKYSGHLILVEEIVEKPIPGLSISEEIGRQKEAHLKAKSEKK
ncbi:MAG: hypothetical protein NW226_22800 [Microscillaceae bacterium]|nr:hypothetical protein [Microscillaceae bacterium]